MHKSSKGFTLIELVVVIAIIAILAAIVLINVAGYIQKANIISIKADMNTLAKSAANYYTTNGNYGVWTNPTDFCWAGDISSPDWPEANIYNSLIANGATDIYCNDPGNQSEYGCATSVGWYLRLTLPDGTTWCVDGNGDSQVPSTTGTANCSCSDAEYGD